MLNQPILGDHLRSTARDAAQAVCAVAETGIEVTHKAGYRPGSSDSTTNADKAADNTYRRSLDVIGVPIVSEDGTKRQQVAELNKSRIVVDAVDGTRSLIKGRMHQVGSMVAAVAGEKVTSAYVTRVTTGAMIGFAPHGPVTAYQSSSGHGVAPLSVTRFSGVKLRDLPVTVRGGVHDYSPLMAELLKPGNAFSGLRPAHGSFGLGFFDLWEGKVAAHILPGSFYETPWDNTPVYGICQRLGIVAYRVDQGQPERYELTLPLDTRQGTELVLIHGTFARQFEEAVRAIAD